MSFIDATIKPYAFMSITGSVRTVHNTTAKEGESKLPKKIAVYGSYVAKVPVKQRYWIKRKDGIKQRYWKTTKRLKKVIMSGRYEFYGKGRDLYKAIMKTLKIVPKGFVDVSAEMFLDDPMKYGYEGMWTDREVVSR